MRARDSYLGVRRGRRRQEWGCECVNVLPGACGLGSDKRDLLTVCMCGEGRSRRSVTCETVIVQV